MKRIGFIKQGLFFLGFFQAMSFSYAGAPVWTFTPLTATTIYVPADSTATVQYQVTNQSNRAHTLAMSSITGVSQITTGAGICSNPFVLPFRGSSCTLSLLVNGSQLTHVITDGPIVCEQGNLLQCYQPSRKDALNITQTTAPSIATITSTSGSPAVLYGINMNWLGDSPALYKVFYCAGNGCNINDFNEIPTGPITSISMETDPGAWSGYSGAICPSSELSYNSITCSNIFFTP